MKTKINTLYSSDPKQILTERCLKIDVRRVDSTPVDLSLEFYPRVMIKQLAGVRTPQPIRFSYVEGKANPRLGLFPEARGS